MLDTTDTRQLTMFEADMADAYTGANAALLDEDDLSSGVEGIDDQDDDEDDELDDDLDDELDDESELYDEDDDDDDEDIDEGD